MCVEKISGTFTFEASGGVVRKSIGMKLSDEGGLSDVPYWSAGEDNI